MPSSEDRQPVILVTGASRGIGYAVTKEVARRGMHPIALARSQAQLEKLDDEIKAEGGKATLITADVTDREMMAKLPEALAARFGMLDGFVANAGVLGELTPVSDILLKDWDNAFAVNVTANVHLITLLDPLLRAAPAGRVVGLSSGAAAKNRPYWAPYAATKAAIEKIFLAYAAENEEMPLKINLVDPGATRTGMREKAMPGEDPMTLPAPEEVAVLIADLLSPEETRTGELIRFRDWRDGQSG